MMAETIFAPASAPGRAGVAVLRLSGPAVRETLQALCGKVPEARRAQRVRLRDPASGETLDDGLALFFPAPASYTGEDVGELHLHGSPAVLAAILAVLGSRGGLRLAEPGEFTRRAFENGKLDLTEAEAVADLIAAETAAQRRQALRQLEGALGDLYRGWSARLLRAVAHFEAAIDFPEEGLPEYLDSEVRRGLQALEEEITAHLADNRRGEILRAGFLIVILGPPNAGKSSLLNALARRDVAITSEIPGTTRDLLEAHLDIGGYPVTVTDTAGLRRAADAIEAEGIRRARERAELAQIVVLLYDAARPEEVPVAVDLAGVPALRVANKLDIATPEARRAVSATGGVGISVRTGEGLPEFLATLEAMIKERYGQGEGPVLTRARHRRALEGARDALRRGLRAPLPELAGEDLRLALREIGRITGRVDVEDLLDVIFREFCIGK